MKFLAGIVLAIATIVAVPSAFASFNPYQVGATAQQVGGDNCDDDSVGAGNSNFCQTFTSVGICHCKAEAGPLGPIECTDMTKIYTNMIKLYRTVENACHAAVTGGHTSKTEEECVADWSCFRNGGTVTIKGQTVTCSATGNSCM